LREVISGETAFRRHPRDRPSKTGRKALTLPRFKCLLLRGITRKMEEWAFRHWKEGTIT